MSTLDAGSEAKKIAGYDHQLDKGAEGAAAELSKDYNQILQENGGNVKQAQQWLKDTTAALAKAGVLPDITIGVLTNEKDNLSSDGNKISKQDIIHDNFLLNGSTSAQQSFDGAFTNMLATNQGGLTDQVNTQLHSDGNYSTGQLDKFNSNQLAGNINVALQQDHRNADAGLFKNVPGTDVSVLQYLDTVKGGKPDGFISKSDIDLALANITLPPEARATILAFQKQLSDNGWENRSVADIFKQDGIVIPNDVDKSNGASIYKASVTAFAKANSDYAASIATADTTSSGGGGTRFLS